MPVLSLVGFSFDFAPRGPTMNARILETIRKSAAVPSMPQVVMRFLEIMQDPSFKYDDLVRVLSADVGTVSEILRLVNSSLFGVRQKIVSLRQALTLLGPKRTRSLLLGRYLVDTMNKKKIAGLDMTYFWRRSLASSVAASRFADKVLPKSRDEVFIAALLADIGLPILAETFPTQYKKIANKYVPLGIEFTPEQEIELVEVNHAQVSAMIIKHWTLPEIVADAVNLSHSPAPGEGEAATAARLLSAADRIGKLLCEVSDPETVVRVCTEATAFIGLEVQSLLDILPSVEKDIEDLAEALRIDVIPSNVYTLIAKAMQDRIAAPAGAV